MSSPGSGLRVRAVSGRPGKASGETDVLSVLRSRGPLGAGGGNCVPKSQSVAPALGPNE